MKRGWFFESSRHRLAARGVRTNYLMAKSPNEKKLRQLRAEYRRAAKLAQSKKDRENMTKAQLDRLEQIRANFAVKSQEITAKLQKMKGVDEEEFTEEGFLSQVRGQKTKKKKSKKATGFISADSEEGEDVESDEEPEMSERERRYAENRKYSAPREEKEFVNALFMELAQTPETVPPAKIPEIVYDDLDNPAGKEERKASQKLKSATITKEKKDRVEELNAMIRKAKPGFERNKLMEKRDDIRVDLGEIEPNEAFTLDIKTKKKPGMSIGDKSAPFDKGSKKILLRRGAGEDMTDKELLSQVKKEVKK